MLDTSDLFQIADEVFMVNDAQGYLPQDIPAWWPWEFQEKSSLQKFDPQYGYIVKNANLSGTIGVCHIDNQVLLDVAYFGRYDLWERNKPYYDQSLICRTSTNEIYLNGTYLSLMGCWSGNYFHWTLEILPMIKTAIKYEKLYGIRPKLILDHYAKPWVYESLKSFGYKYEDTMRCDSMNMTVENLLVAPAGRKDGHTLPSTVKFLRTNLAGTNNYPRIYFSRGDTVRRVVVNEEELLPSIRKHGFVSIHAGQHSWSDQVALMKGADMIAGPHGAALANIVYAQPGATVIELATPEYFNPCFYTLASVCGHRYNLYVGEPMAGENIYIRKEIFDEAIS